MGEFTCTLCGGPIDFHAVSFVEDEKRWTLTIRLCKRPACLTRRGATSVDQKTLAS